MTLSHFVVVVKPARLTQEDARDGIRIHGIRIFKPRHLIAIRQLARQGALGRVSLNRIFLRPVVRGTAEVNRDLPLFLTYDGVPGRAVRTTSVFAVLESIEHAYVSAE